VGEDRLQTINVGDEEEIFHTITLQDVENFAKLTGDYNPLHMSDEYASKTSFKKKVVHGMLTASFISTIIGTKLPGAGALWFEQCMRFLAPVRVGEKIRIYVKVIQKSELRRVIVLQTIVFGEGNRKVIEGEGKVEVLKQQEEEKNDELTAGSDKGAVIVTGASRGIGAATAYKLAELGYKVVVNYRSSSQSAEKIVNTIINAGGRAISIQADVSSLDQVKNLVSQSLDSFDSIESVVNNASPEILNRDFIEMDWADIQEQIDVHLKGTFNICKEIIPHFLEQNRGSIVNIGSVYSTNVPPIKMSAYCLCKTALGSLTRSLAVEYGPKGIRANIVSPGMTQTDLIADVPQKTKVITKMNTPLRRLGDPKWVAETIAFLIGDESAHITGQNFSVCGGISMNS
jgi:3-oxoacyl-[acyl-carrier protein] reductase